MGGGQGGLSRQRAAKAFPVLAETAKQGGTMTYQELGDILGCHARAVPAVLAALWHNYCAPNNLPPLQLIVVNKDQGLPGAGCLAARAQGGAQRREMAARERQRVHSYKSWDQARERLGL